MCTVLLLHDVHPTVPLAVIANRDELLSREATPPRVLHEHPRAIGGVDASSGGTWMGANERGLFVALTNQRSVDPPDRTRRSRGDVVLRALALSDASEVEAMLRGIDAREYNGFNLLFGGLGDVRVAYARDTGDGVIEVQKIAPGLVVLPNDRIGSPEFPKIARATERAHEALARRDDAMLLASLADHEMPSLEATPGRDEARFPPEILRALQALCVHLPFYGTVSATAILYGPDGHVARYLFADGPPCVTAFDDVTALLVPESHENPWRKS